MWRVLLAVVVVTLLAVSAFAEVTLPNTGVDVGAYASAAIVGLGAVVAVAVGGYMAFLLIRKGLRWAGRIA
jgi:hypothetical protein